MFASRHDPLRALAVIVLAPPANDSDVGDYVACVQLLDQVGNNREGAALVLVLEEGYPLPDAETRKKAVDARRGMKSRPVVSVVTKSALLRAALKAAHWISPPPFEQHVAASFEEAVQYIESKRGPTLRLLDKMYDEATAQMDLLAPSRR